MCHCMWYGKKEKWAVNRKLYGDHLCRSGAAASFARAFKLLREEQLDS